jgi:hypothetical protein
MGEGESGSLMAGSRFVELYSMTNVAVWVGPWSISSTFTIPKRPPCRSRRELLLYYGVM